MTQQLERELHLLFAEDAEQAPAAGGLVDGARRRARRHRRSRLAWGTGALVAASAAGVAVLGGPLTGSPVNERTATPVAARSPADQRTGALPDAANGSCAFGYSARELARRAFVFDGTVTAFGPAHTDRPSGVISHVGVTFTVNEWFAGGSGTTFTIDMPPPSSYLTTGYGPGAYRVGTRLLVSGNHRWDGSTTDDAVAHYCGFTRYYDKSTADSWREATR